MYKNVLSIIVCILCISGFIKSSMAADTYDPSNFSADGRKWQPAPSGHIPGKDNGSGTGTHNAGEDCGICHRPNGKAVNYIFTMGGTLYEDRAARKVLRGAEVMLQDINGNVISMTTNSAGNFWTYAAIGSNPCAVANHGGATTILYTLDANGNCVPNDLTGADSRAWQYKAWVKNGDNVRPMVSIVPVGGASDAASRMSCNMHHSSLGSSGGVWASKKSTLLSYPSSGLSFRKHTQPIFRSKCGPCHIPGYKMTRATTKSDIETPSTAIDYSSGMDLTSYAGSTVTAIVSNATVTVTKRGAADPTLVNVSDPDSSLLLTKTSQGSTHAGGWFWTAEDADYKAIRQWIIEGALNN